MSTKYKTSLAWLTALIIVGGIIFTVQQRELNDRIQAGKQNCELAKTDRIDNARGWTAIERLLLHRQKAVEATPEGKEENLRLLKRVSESANQLRIRLYHCDELIEDDKRRIDRDALDEAHGKL
jgi:hypothetical protein